MSVEHQLDRLWLETVAPWHRKVIFAEKHSSSKPDLYLHMPKESQVVNITPERWGPEKKKQKTDVNVGL